MMELIKASTEWEYMLYSNNMKYNIAIEKFFMIDIINIAF